MNIGITSYNLYREPTEVRLQATGTEQLNIDVEEQAADRRINDQFKR